MYSASESEAKVADKELLFITDSYLFMTAFIRVALRLRYESIPMGYPYYQCFSDSNSHKN